MKKRVSKLLAFIMIFILFLPMLGRMKSAVAVMAAEPKLNKSSVELTEGEKYQLSVKNMDESSVDSVTWKANRTSVVTVTAKGKLTAVAAGSTTVKCTITYKDSTKKTLSCSIKVKTPSGGVALNTTSKSIVIGDTLQLKTKNLDSDTVKSITWKSNRTSVAVVSKKGLVTGVTKGSADIECTITYNDGTKKTIVCYVTVKEDVSATAINLSGIMIGDNNAVNMYVGDTVTAKATLTDSEVKDKIVWTSKHPHIATVKDGKVTAKKMGITAIVATAGDVSEEFFVNVMESEKTTATPTPTITPKENVTNREWISVEGGWEFTIDSVEVHELCNQFSDENDSEQCIIVTYSYKNTGFYGYQGEDSLYISDMDISVYDEEGVKAETYPCTHTKSPADIVAGTKCSKAQAAYALENASDEITLVVEIYRYDIKKDVTQKFIVNVGNDEGSPIVTVTPTKAPAPTATPKPTATPVPTVAVTPKPTNSEDEKIGKNFDILKEYIMVNGEDTEKGKKIIATAEEYNVYTTITYSYAEDKFIFHSALKEEMTSGDECVTVFQFEWSKKHHENTMVYMLFTDAEISYELMAQAVLDGTKYNGEDLDFIVLERAYTAKAFEESVLNLASTQFKIGMLTLDALLSQECDLSLSDIGFKSSTFYENYSLTNTKSNTTSATQVTTSQQQAVKMAKHYLESIAFSRTGLIEQLEYEGFSKLDAAYGVDNCGANWYEQAAKCARSYLNSMAFSRSGLIEQLEYEGFTYDQAVYGAEQNGL